MSALHRRAGDRDPGSHELARAHAPILRLHPREEYFPMRPEDFLRGCRLELVQKLAAGFRRTAVWDPAARVWDTNPDDLDHHGVPAGLLERWSQLHVTPPEAGWSRRPFGDRLAPDGHLFALAHRSMEPGAAFDQERPPPAYYTVDGDGPERWIGYWFFYGFSRFLWSWAHQGDWEHLRLRIRNGRVQDALFAVHEDLYRVPADRLRFRDGRLVAWSARNRHATWWKAGRHLPLPLFKDEATWAEVRRPRRGFLEDETSDGGAVWDTARDLRPLVLQGWRLYAGAWGRLGDGPHTTGPLGPWHKRVLEPDRTIVEE